MAALRKRVRIKQRPGQQQGQKVKGWTKVNQILENEFLSLSLSELDNKLRSQLAVRYKEQFGDDISSSGFGTGLREGKEPDIDNYYDPPDMESEIETGEEGKGSGYRPESTENFWQYTWRRLDEDYEHEEDKEFYNYIANCLRKWQSSDFSLRDIRNDLKNIRDDLKLWFEELLEEFPSHEPDTPESRIKKADIVFYTNESGISYEINLGYLEQYSHDQSVMGKKEIPFTFKEGYSLLPEQIPLTLHRCREKLQLLAEFLKEKYTEIIRNTDFKALNDLRTYKQKDFLDYCESRGYKIDEPSISKLVNNKLIKLPSCDEPLSLNIFFSGDQKEIDKKIDVINVLKKMIALHIQEKRNSPLTSPDQLVIVKLLCDTEIKARNLRSTYWKELQKEYPKEQWIEYGIKGKQSPPTKKQSISDKELTKLINDIKRELGIPKKQFTEKDIEAMRKVIRSDTK